jgi:hypothetical protein
MMTQDLLVRRPRDTGFHVRRSRAAHRPTTSPPSTRHRSVLTHSHEIRSPASGADLDATANSRRCIVVQRKPSPEGHPQAADHPSRRSDDARSSTHRRDPPMRTATARYQRPTSGPRSTSPESPGGSGKEANNVGEQDGGKDDVHGGPRQREGGRNVELIVRRQANSGDGNPATQGDDCFDAVTSADRTGEATVWPQGRWRSQARSVWW